MNWRLQPLFLKIKFYTSLSVDIHTKTLKIFIHIMKSGFDSIVIYC